MNDSVTLGRKVIGDGHPTFIVFEAGPTHDGLETAKYLCDHAVAAGADAIKFQILDPDRLVADKKQLFSYDILIDKRTGKTETVSEPLYDILCRRTLSRGEWRALKQHCDQLGLVFFSTATFVDEVDFIVDLGCETIKICSGDVDYFDFIACCARTGCCLQFDTGNATVGEVESAVDAASHAGNDRVIIHNCPSGYPARLESINLRLIPTLKRMFRCPVAFSDHTPGWDMDIAAVALGANLVEKTITLDRSTPSVEHIFSLEPHEMKAFVNKIREIEIALGSERRHLSPEERRHAAAVRRSIVAAKDCRAGDIIGPDMIACARPGFGLRPEMMHMLIGMVLARDVSAGSPIRLDDICSQIGRKYEDAVDD